MKLTVCLVLYNYISMIAKTEIGNWQMWQYLIFANIDKAQVSESMNQKLIELVVKTSLLSSSLSDLVPRRLWRLLWMKDLGYYIVTKTAFDIVKCQTPSP